MASIEEIQVGDKIRATSFEGGEVITGRVKRKLGADIVQMVMFSLHSKHWKFEILEKALPELPTGHLAVVGKAGWTPYVRINSTWWDMEVFKGHKNVHEASEREVQRAIANDGYVVLCDGITTAEEEG